MDTNAGQSAQKTAESISKVVIDVAKGIIKVGEAAPGVKEFCTVLWEVKKIVDQAKRNKVELKEQHAQCELITVHVIDRAKDSLGQVFDIAPIEGCVDDIKELVERCGKQGMCARLMQVRKNKDDIQKLRTRIGGVLQTMGLAGIATVGDRLEELTAMVVRFLPKEHFLFEPNCLIGHSCKF